MHVAWRVFLSSPGRAAATAAAPEGQLARQTAWWLVSEFDAVVAASSPYHRTYRLGLSPPDTYSLQPNARTAEVVYVWKACSNG